MPMPIKDILDSMKEGELKQVDLPEGRTMIKKGKPTPPSLFNNYQPATPAKSIMSSDLETPRRTVERNNHDKYSEIEIEHHKSI